MKSIELPVSTRQPRFSAQIARATGATAMGTLALGSFALGAMSMGALAIGALAIGRLALGKAKIKTAELGDVTIDRLRVRELIVERTTQGEGSPYDDDFVQESSASYSGTGMGTVTPG